MAHYEENENELTKEEQQKANEEMAHTDEKVIQKVKEKDLSKDEAEKERAKEVAEEKTGVNADVLADLSKDVLKIKDGLEKPDLEMIKKGREAVDSAHVHDLLDKMRDSEVAENIVKAGLGSEHISTGKSGLMEGAQTVLEKGLEYSKDSEMGDDLATSCDYGRGLSKESDDKKKEQGEEKNSEEENAEDKNQKENEDSSDNENDQSPVDILLKKKSNRSR